MRLLAIAAAAVVLASGCGDDEPRSALQIPDEPVAEVGGQVVSGEDLRAYMAEVEASYAARGRPFPEEGSAEHRNVLAEAVETLVGDLRNEALAAELGAVVTDAQIDETIARTWRLNPDADGQLEEWAVSADRYRATVRASLVRHEIFKTVTAGSVPSEQELRALYEESAHNVPFEEAKEGMRLELMWERQAAAMEAWKADAEARLVSLTHYTRGWDPQELRSYVPFPVPPKQKSYRACGLPDGEYAYEELLEKGCAAEFLIPGRDGPPCAVPLVDVPLAGGFSPEEVESGYSNYLADTAGSCVPDPRGQRIGFYYDPERRLVPRFDDD
jgi:hypothetical protein